MSKWSVRLPDFIQCLEQGRFVEDHAGWSPSHVIKYRIETSMGFQKGVVARRSFQPQEIRIEIASRTLLKVDQVSRCQWCGGNKRPQVDPITVVGRYRFVEATCG